MSSRLLRDIKERHSLLTIGLVGVIAFLCLWTFLAIAFQSSLVPILLAYDAVLVADIVARSRRARRAR